MCANLQKKECVKITTPIQSKKVATKQIKKGGINTVSSCNNSSEEGVTDQISEHNISKTLQTNKIHLTLDNFDRDEEIPPDCPFVLTSPRSLEACKQLGVRVRENAIS